MTIDCAARVHLCRAACCRLYEVPGKYSPSPGGRCESLAKDQSCGVYLTRPGACRAFDCRGDERIWKDFEKRLPAEDLERRLRGDGPAPTR